MIAFIRSRKPELKKRIVKVRITVRGHTMMFNMEATRWLSFYLDK